MFTTSSKWTGLGLNPELRGESPATNRHYHGMAQEIVIFKYVHMGTNDQKYNIIVIYKGYAKFLTP
jgi:hypothetical protein